MRRIPAAVAATVLGLTLLAGCGDAETPAASTQETRVIDITVADGTTTPAGERIEVGVGQPIELRITADEPGELHVHTDPEQELEYAEGTSTISMAPVSRPGVVEVESHTLDRLVLQLQAQ